MSNLYYGLPPKVLAKNMHVDLVKDKVEMCFYQYLPIKMAGALENFHIPVQLNWIRQFIQYLEFDPHTDFIYVSVKHLFVTPNNMGNRPGWHSDGFGSDDVNYIWSDKFPTQFCLQEFTLTEDHVESLKELNRQALDENIVDYGENAFVRIDRWNIHRPPVEGTGFRTFLKFSVSKNRYNLQGNSHNYLMDYDWKMIPRHAERNHPTADTKGNVDGEYSIVLPNSGVKLQLQAPKLRPPLTSFHDCVFNVPGARNKPLITLGDIMDRLRNCGVQILPVCNSSVGYDSFEPNNQICLEFIIRDILLKKGYKEYINMNQCKPSLIRELVATGYFGMTRTIRAQPWPGFQFKHEQRQFARPVNALNVLLAPPSSPPTLIERMQRIPAERAAAPEKVGSVSYNDAEVEIREMMRKALKIKLKMPNAVHDVFVDMRDFIQEWLMLKVDTIPVRHFHKPFHKFAPNEQVSVEYILRKLVYKAYGSVDLANKAQATPAVIHQLTVSGIFMHTKAFTVKWTEEGKPQDVADQKVYTRPVKSLTYSEKLQRFDEEQGLLEKTCKDAIS